MSRNDLIDRLTYAAAQGEFDPPEKDEPSEGDDD